MEDQTQTGAQRDASRPDMSDTDETTAAGGQSLPMVDSTQRDLARGTPFLGEEYVLTNRVAMRDDLSITQTRTGGTSSVTSRHVRNFLYDQPFHTDAPGYHETRSQPRVMPLKPEER